MGISCVWKHKSENLKREKQKQLCFSGFEDEDGDTRTPLGDILGDLR